MEVMRRAWQSGFFCGFGVAPLEVLSDGSCPIYMTPNALRTDQRRHQYACGFCTWLAASVPLEL